LKSIGDNTAVDLEYWMLHFCVAFCSKLRVQFSTCISTPLRGPKRGKWKHLL